MRVWKFLYCFAALILFAAAFVSPAWAQTTKANVYDELTVWYAAHTDAIELGTAQDLINSALAPAAAIGLKSFDIVQSKTEYLESFEVWRDAIEGGLVAHRVEDVENSAARITVCYVFEGNSLLTNEIIVFNDDMQIASLVAEELADNCEAF